MPNPPSEKQEAPELFTVLVLPGLKRMLVSSQPAFKLTKRVSFWSAVLVESYCRPLDPYLTVDRSSDFHELTHDAQALGRFARSCQDLDEKPEDM